MTAPTCPEGRPECDVALAGYSATHGPARTVTDSWTVNICEGAGVLIRRAGPGQSPAEHRHVVLSLTRQDAAAMAQAILEGLIS